MKSTNQMTDTYYVIKTKKDIVKVDTITNKFYNKETYVYVSVLFLQGCKAIIKYNESIFTTIHYSSEEAKRAVYELKMNGIKAFTQELTPEYRNGCLKKSSKKVQSW